MKTWIRRPCINILENELGEAETVMEGLELNDFLGEVLGLANKLRKNAGDAKATI